MPAPTPDSPAGPTPPANDWLGGPAIRRAFVKLAWVYAAVYCATTVSAAETAAAVDAAGQVAHMTHAVAKCLVAFVATYAADRVVSPSA